MNGVEALRQIRKAELRLTALMERRRRCLELENGIGPGRSEELEALRRKLEAQAHKAKIILSKGGELLSYAEYRRRMAAE